MSETDSMAGAPFPKEEAGESVAALLAAAKGVFGDRVVQVTRVLRQGDLEQEVAVYLAAPDGAA